ncbi:proteasome subunit beta type-7 [Penicillium longicatenatum]|uniref:proteasome subunit beta type-7 n=1 Tax=Penicillium longicatenatum TaxID=1561947 RepID=UPI00254707F9|nr:proteasome subunit beta type-7 [Penicillium longicatenatum]KAJ5650052.1 proteasome subunit beta type-7 [Penicillium longicatenatum]KAJ5672405.1 proteasome subunit beta type-7 [Penicillium longicatenatum]
MDHFPGTWGRVWTPSHEPVHFVANSTLQPRNDVYGAYNPAYLQTTGPKTHTSSPAVTGTSVIGVKFNGGVVLATDNLASYGSLARFTDVKRLRVFGDNAVVGFGGDVSDMQYIDRLLESIDIRENYSTHGNMLNAKNLHTYLSKVFYKRRSEFNPLWNHVLVAGFDVDGKPFLSSADLLGTTFSAPHLATGFGAHLAVPILRRRFPEEMPIEDITREEAVSALKDCLKVLFYRDARSIDKYSIAVITKEGIDLKEDEQIEGQSWAFAERIRGYGRQTN